MWDVVIGLGGNLGDRLARLRDAVAGFAPLGTLVAVSRLYETDPIGPAQPLFLNAAARLTSAIPPHDLLSALLELERRAGRERRERWGPRTLDLDVLWIHGLSCDDVGLKVPHPELRRRAFALLPLLDVAPDAVDPRDGEPYSRVAVTLDRAGVRELSSAPESWAFELTTRA